MIRAAITGSLMILIVVILRVCFKRFPGKVRCALWILCCIRLILPFTLLLPILPQKTEVIPVTMQAAAVAETENVEAVTLDEPKEVSTVDKREDQKVDVKTILLCLYLIGVIVMLASMLIGTIRVLRKTRYAVPRLHGEKDKYYACEGIGTAFVFGVFRPKIYVPFSLGDEELPFVLAHEAYHIRHRHYILKQVESLPLTESQVILMKYYQNMALNEIADQLNMSRSSVKRYLRSARRHLERMVF